MSDPDSDACKPARSTPIKKSKLQSDGVDYVPTLLLPPQVITGRHLPKPEIDCDTYIAGEQTPASFGRAADDRMQLRLADLFSDGLRIDRFWSCSTGHRR